MFDDKTTANPPSNLPTEPEDMFNSVDNVPMAPPTKTPNNALEAGVLKKKAPFVSTMPMENSVTINENKTLSEGVPIAHEPIVGKIFLVIIVIVLIGGLGFAGWWLYNRFLVKNNDSVLPLQTALPIPSLDTKQPEDSSVTVSPGTEADTFPAESVPPSDVSSTATKIKNDSILFGEDIDTDKDGLGDSKERELGTDINNSDTDADGLKDGEEILIYQVDPLKADTDGDGLADGEEVNMWRTNPINPDTDGDSFPDGREVRNGYNPLGPGKFSVTSTVAEKLPLGSTTTKIIKK